MEFRHDRLRRRLDAAGPGAGRARPRSGRAEPAGRGGGGPRRGRRSAKAGTSEFGGPHAEVNALAAAGDAARGATLYVTLEPCCHHGKTPPCTDAILRAGIKRVVAAMADPFPEVAGQRHRGRCGTPASTCDVGVCESEARDLNRPYLTLLRLGRPYVHAKWAMSLDGKIATRTGHSKWISGDGRPGAASTSSAAGWTRSSSAAGTVRADDPLLTARPPGPRMPARIVLDEFRRDCRSACRLLTSAGEAPVMMATVAGHATTARPAGREVLELPAENGRPSVAAVTAGTRPAADDERAGRRRGDGVRQLSRRRADRRVARLCRPENDRRDRRRCRRSAGWESSTVDGGRPLSISRWEQVGNDLYVNARFGPDSSAGRRG